jgi:surface carbohydrate biosynthesis protein
MPRGRAPLIIPAETQARELDAKLLLACAAAERGFPVILGEKKRISLRIDRLPRGVFVAKGVTRRHRRIFRLLRQLGFSVVAGDEEGLVHPSAEHYLRAKVGPEALAQVETLLAWGPENARAWRESPGYAGAPIRETGNPRTDLLRPGLRDFFAAEADVLVRRFGRFVLVNTNFSRLNHYLPHMSWQRQLLERSGAAPDAEDAFEVGLARHRAAIFGAFLAMVPAVARAHPDCAVVVRPHPSESHEPWREAAGSLPNVHVVYEGSVVPWLLAARATLHNGCTTGFEAHLLGRPAVAFQPVASDRFDNHLPNGLSFAAFSLPQLLEQVDRALRDALVPDASELEARRKLLAHHVTGVEGRLAADRVVDALEEFESGRSGRRPSAFGRALGRIGTARRRRKKLAEARQPGTRSHPNYVRHVFPGLAPEDVDARIARFRALLGRFEGVEARRLEPDVFEVRRAG